MPDIYKIKFEIDRNSRIEMIFPYALVGLHPCTHVVVTLIIGMRKVELNQDLCGGIMLRDFYDILSGFKFGNRIIDQQIEGDLGMISGDIIAGLREEFPCVQKKDFCTWKGYDYIVWSSTQSRTETWMYLKNEVVHLDVTPYYPWHFNSPAPGETYISYDEFRKNYTPVAQLVISMEIIKKWERKAAKLLAIIEKNQNKLNKKYKVGQYGPHGSGM